LQLYISEVVVYVNFRLIFKEIILSLSSSHVGKDEILEQFEYVLFEEGFHVRPEHQTFEELETVEDNIVVFGIF